jgi:hypothetical protein
VGALKMPKPARRRRTHGWPLDERFGYLYSAFVASKEVPEGDIYSCGILPVATNN